MNNGMTYKEIREWLESYKPDDNLVFYEATDEEWAEYNCQKRLIIDLLDDLKIYENTL